MLQLMDSYAATYAVLIIALVECLALSWVYGRSPRYIKIGLIRIRTSLAFIKLFASK